MNKSFTLIEILVVIVIIGIISAFIIVSMSGVSQKANIAKGQAFSNSLKNSLLLNLVSEWKLNETSGTEVSDSWSGGNTGTWYGEGGDYTSPSWRTGSECVSGGCLAFDGYDDYINCGTDTSLDIIKNITIELWIKPNILTGIRGLVTKRTNNVHSPYVFLQNGTRINLNYYGIDSAWHMYYSDYGVTDDWQHIAVIFSPATNKAYFFRNGVSFGVRDTVSSGASQPTYPVIIGWDAGYNAYDGFIDEIRIFNEIVSASEIKENYYSGLNRLLANSGIEKQEYARRINEFLAQN